ncbi:50S ribosomal protein L4 [soil metagenome]
MLKINSYSAKGIKLTGSMSLPKEWEAKDNPALLAQAMRVYIDKAHPGLRKTQTRAEVKRTKKKVYAQKGTGGARHGSRRAPIFVGGGVAHGPRPVSRVLILPKLMRRKAMAVAMTIAVKEERVMGGELTFKKTNEAQKFINKIITKKEPRVTFVLRKENSETNRYLRNIKNVDVLTFPAINAFDVFFGGNIIIDNKMFDTPKEKKVIKKVTKEKITK